MPNIDPVYLITPTATIAFSFGLVIYWHYRRSFSQWALIYSLAAYGGAIALKYAVQIPTIGAFQSAYGSSPVALGLYYGAQTALFEVGGAFVVASMAVSRKKFSAKDAGGYGLGLAFWENGVLIGIPLLINYATYYIALSMPSSSLAQLILPVLTRNSPGLFYSPAAALPLVFYAVLERVSSLMVHFAWGFLCVMAAVYRRKLFFAIALPMGLIDTLVPFVGVLGVGVFELTVFLVSAACLVVALRATSSIRSQAGRQADPAPQPQ